MMSQWPKFVNKNHEARRPEKIIDVIHNGELLKIRRSQIKIRDKLYLRIEKVSDYLNYSWNVIVNKLDITYKNWTRLEEIWVSSWYVYIDSFSNKINNLNDRINILNI